MNKEFSPYLLNNKEVLTKIVTTLSKKFSYVSLLASDCEGKTIKVTDKEIKVTDSSWQERGFVVRVYNKGIYSEYSFNNIPSVKNICDSILASTAIDDSVARTIYLSKTEYKVLKEKKLEKDFSKMDKFEDMSVDEVIKRCDKIIHNSMEDNEYIVSARCVVEDLKISKMFISANRVLTQVYGWGCAKYNCVLNRDETTKFNYGGESSISLKEALNKLERKIKGINIDATKLLDSTRVSPGEYDCITTPIVTGLIAHEAFGHGVEMDMFVKNRAKAKDYIGKKVGSELVTMHEGATPYEDVSSYFFDDEGTLANDTIEIKNGVLLTGVADSLAALKLGIEPTGNGKRESFERKAYTRMTTTYFERKNDILKDMIASINYGFLIDGEISGMEDPKSWGIQCVCLIGREISNGELTGRYVSPLVLTGYVPDLLNSVSMVSKDFELYGNGICGKGYKERVKTSIGGPYLKVKVKLG